ncbi:SRS domain-containing protein [Neospora caninum Liverpool]|uniref:SRS domain-containing protein n=1 Tax=Neospora caninum (strain Liverpool) TaxID=572307 RepID=F0VL90_NEOCL|nr:SRS domain-containing protein [Neospora caninum Liverpool]CBZ54842.1 SRS domain-containing protein [Neospora caninum Liverpool]CEL69561.1 TPA: SRS domain-containing protein [Neospora caninum Liverpool]|eukprot:XP_003884870.1 SRS domain-containing protein [Neospora caninum Liverpool]
MSRFCLCERVSHCCLAILLAGVLLKPVSFAVSPPPTQEPSPVPTCDKTHSERATLETELSLTVGPEQDSVSFKCSSTANAQREPDKDNVYTDEECKNAVPLTGVFENAVLEESVSQDNTKTTYKLTIPRASRKTEKEILYYKCTLDTTDGQAHDAQTLAEAGRECKVKITVDEVTKPDPEHEQNGEQQASIIECGDPTATKQATVSAESPLSFKCGAGMSLHPTNLTDVFDDQDGKCAAEVALQTLVDATLTKAETDPPQNEQPVYQLVVKTAPSGDTALCYKCVTTSSNLETKTNSEEESAAKECLLKISVKGSATSASAKRASAPSVVAFFVAAQMSLGLVYMWI